MDTTSTVTWRTRSLSIDEYIASTYTLYAQYYDNIRSRNEEAEFRMQPDGNLVLYRLNQDGSESPVWASNTQNVEQSYTAVLEDSGDLNVYNQNNVQQWTSKSKNGLGPFRLSVSDDVIAYIVDAKNNILWMTDWNTPIQAPTLNPNAWKDTKPPSIHPTNVPSHHPTQAPSFNPIIIPSAHPITFNPTIHPTKIPSIHPTQSPSAHPIIASQSINPTIRPTNAPSFHPTNIDVAQETGTITSDARIVNIDIEFEYECSLDCGTIPFSALYSICEDISHDLLQNDIRRIEDSCVDRTEYIISINPQTQYVITTATIHVCNDNTLSVVSNLANIVVQEPILIDQYLNNDMHVPQTTAFVIDTTYLGDTSTKETESHQIVIVLVAVLGSVLTICIVMVVIKYVKHDRKVDLTNNKSNSLNAHEKDIEGGNEANYVQYNHNNGAARYRIPTISESKARQRLQTDEMKVALSDDGNYDEFMPPGPYPMHGNVPSTSDTNVNIPVSIPKFGAGAISLESASAMSPYSSVVAREMMVDYNVDTMGNHGELLPMENDNEVNDAMAFPVNDPVTHHKNSSEGIPRKIEMVYAYDHAQPGSPNMGIAPLPKIFETNGLPPDPYEDEKEEKLQVFGDDFGQRSERKYSEFDGGASELDPPRPPDVAATPGFGGDNDFYDAMFAVTILGDEWDDEDDFFGTPLCPPTLGQEDKNSRSNKQKKKKKKEDPDASASEKRKRIEAELISTEKTYLAGLRVLMYEFIEPIFEAKLIPHEHRKTITCNVPQLIRFHEQFLAELQQRAVSTVFHEQSAYFKMYITYIAEYENICDTFARFRKNKKLAALLEKMANQNKPLSNFLILPIQRTPRYMLLLGDLKKNTPSTVQAYKEIERALKEVNSVCVEINEKKRAIENMSQCLKISETLKGLEKNIVEPHRQFVDHFLFRRKKDKRNRQFFVFSDIVIIANPKWEVKSVCKLTKFFVKRANVASEEIMINIVEDDAVEDDVTAYVALRWDDIPNKHQHPNVSNLELFCDVLQKYRDQHAILFQKNDNIKQMLRAHEDEEELIHFEASNKKGNKSKVLAMLGTPAGPK
eukprot:198875_1